MNKTLPVTRFIKPVIFVLVAMVAVRSAYERPAAFGLFFLLISMSLWLLSLGYAIRAMRPEWVAPSWDLGMKWVVLFLASAAITLVRKLYDAHVFGGIGVWPCGDYEPFWRDWLCMASIFIAIALSLVCLVDFLRLRGSIFRLILPSLNILALVLLTGQMINYKKEYVESNTRTEQEIQLSLYKSTRKLEFLKNNPPPKSLNH